jgi:type II secretory ATPase GspE/PulE/Tfp pilus assembly ATPase PilB-like protein
MITTATKIKELNFSDLYLGHPGMEDRFSDVPGAAANPVPASPVLREDLQRLTQACRDEHKRMGGHGDFRIGYDDVNYRISVMPTLGGEVFVVRKIAAAIPSLAELGIPQAYIRRLMVPDLSGLFVVAGAIKSGKTMTACAMLKDRLTAYGGVAVTGEDLIELPLEGSHGAGVCFQTMAPRDPASFVDSFRHLVRWGARVILIDEIRDQDVAAEVLQASVSGHLIITTMLAENVVQAVTKLHALANDRLAPGSARSLIADGLAGVLHQQMYRPAKHSAKVETEFLFLKDAPLIRASMRKGDYELLRSDIRQQMTSMIAENAAAQRMATA